MRPRLQQCNTLHCMSYSNLPPSKTPAMHVTKRPSPVVEVATHHRASCAHSDVLLKGQATTGLDGCGG